MKTTEYTPMPRCEQGFIVMQDGSNFYESWYHEVLPQKAKYLRENRMRQYANMTQAFMWLVCTPDKEQLQLDMFELSLVQLLTCDRILRERKQGGLKQLNSFFSLMKSEERLYNIVRRVVEHNRIDWISLSDTTVCLKP